MDFTRYALNLQARAAQVFITGVPPLAIIGCHPTLLK